MAWMLADYESHTQQCGQVAVQYTGIEVLRGAAAGEYGTVVVKSLTLTGRCISDSAGVGTVYCTICITP